MVKANILVVLLVVLVGFGLGCGFAKPIATPLPIPTALPNMGSETKIIQSRVENSRIKSLTVEVGSIVEWTNYDVSVHTITHAPPFGMEKFFDSLRLENEQQFRVLFDKVGSYFYICNIHSTQMTATVTVVAKGES